VNLAQRLLTGSLALIAVLVAAIVIIAGRRLNDRLATETEDELRREAALIGVTWSQRRSNPDSLADAAGKALERRVTLIDSNGVVIGDSEFSGEGLLVSKTTPRAPRSPRRAQLASAIRSDERIGGRRGDVRGDAPSPRVRSRLDRDVTVPRNRRWRAARRPDRLHHRDRRRRISGNAVLGRRLAPDRGAARRHRAIAAGDLTRKPSLSAPGEVGDLAASVSRMTDELGIRLKRWRLRTHDSWPSSKRSMRASSPSMVAKKSCG